MNYYKIFKLFIINIIFLISIFNYQGIYIDYLVLLALTYNFSNILLFYTISSKKFNLSYSLIFYCFLLDCFYLIAPFTYIYIGDIYLYGKNMMIGINLSISLFIIANISLLLGYNYFSYDKKLVIFKFSNYYNFKLLIIIWFIGCISSLIVLIQTGFSLTYIFSAGTNGEVETGQESNSLFLINFSYLMIVPSLIILKNSKYKYFAILIVILTFLQYFIRGTRFIMIIYGGSLLFVYFYRIKHKYISDKLFLIIISFGIIINSIIGFFRTFIKTQDSSTIIETDSFSDILSHSLDKSFEIIKPYFITIDNVENKSLYSMGKATFIEPLLNIIPRSLWSNKPQTEDFTVTKIMIDSCGYDSYFTYHLAMPNFAEYYIEFGFFGIIFFMFITGLILKKIDSLRFNLNKNIVFYSVSYFVLFHIITRGYTVYNLYIILFIFLPFFILNYLNKKRFKPVVHL